MAETEHMPVTSTIQAFLEKIKKLNEENPEQSKLLYGELMLWGASVAAAEKVPAETALGEIIESQINFAVQKQREKGRQITVEEFVEGLFSPNPAGEISAEIIMGRLQLG